MFLCETVLGNEDKKYQATNVTGLPNAKHQSVKGVGRRGPSENENIYLGNGCVVPIGEMVDQKD